MWLKDPKNKKKNTGESVTLTLTILVTLFVCVKVFFSGFEYKSFKVGLFTGLEGAALIAPFLAAYTARRHNNKK